MKEVERDIERKGSLFIRANCFSRFSFPATDFTGAGAPESIANHPLRVTAQKYSKGRTILNQLKELRFMNLGEMRQASIETPMSFRVDNLLPTGSVNNLIGKPKIGKSTLLRQLAAAVATGSDFLGRSTDKADVLYFALEEQRAQLWDQFESLGMKDDEGIFATTDMVQGDVLAQLAQTLDSMPAARLILIDPMFKFLRARDNNDYAETSTLMERLNQFAKERSLTIVCAHHEKKRQTEDVGDGTLGSTAIRAGSDTNLFLKQDRNGVRTLQTEQRYGIAMEPTLLQFDTAARRFSIDVSVTFSIQQATDDKRHHLMREITDYVRDHPGVGQPEILECLTGSTQAKVQALKVLASESTLERSGTGGKGDPYIYSLSELEVASGPRHNAAA